VYLILLYLTGLAAFGSAAIAYLCTRDTFHPLMFLGPMLAYPYFVTPLMLDQDVVERFLPTEWLPFVQMVYLMGVVSLALGALYAGRPRQRRTAGDWSLTPRLRGRLRLAGQALGLIGVAAYFHMVFNVGGFQAAYGEAHGQGWAASGYVREARFWVLPGLLLFMLSRGGRGFRWQDLLWMSLLGGPLLFHGIVGGWRGHTFAVLATVGIGWYMIRARRPSLVTFVCAGVVLALIVLTLVTHRSMLALGGEAFEFRGTEAYAEFTARESRGNEYILGSGLIIDAAIRDEYQWGGRYVTNILIRPVPRGVWPTQYRDVSRWLGIEGYGTVLPTLGWAPTGGASVGFLADMWKQFWWLGLVVVFVLGRLYGVVWRRACESGGLWVITYVLLIALSLYMTQQTVPGAFLWRLMLMAGAAWIVWRLLVHRTWRRAQVMGSRTWGRRLTTSNLQSLRPGAARQ